MTRQRAFAMTLALVAGLLPAPARSDGEAPADPRSSTGSKRLVLVELFTSQG